MTIDPGKSKNLSSIKWKFIQHKIKIGPLQNENCTTAKYKFIQYKMKVSPLQNENLSNTNSTVHKNKIHAVQSGDGSNSKCTNHDLLLFESCTLTLLQSIPQKIELNHFNNSNSISSLYFQSLFSSYFSMNSSFQNERPIYREKIVRKKLDSFFPPTDDSVSRNEVSSVAIFLVAGCSCNRRPIQIYCTWYFSVTPSSPSRCCCAWYSAAR